CAVVWRVEPDVHLSYVAENALRVLGYAPDYLLRDDVNYESIVNTDERQELLDRMQRLIDGEEDALEMDYRVLAEHEGKPLTRWVHHYARADKDHDGKVLRVRGYLLDDSKGKELELKLQEANDNFDIALTAGGFFTWSWLIQSNHLEVSHRWQEFLGYTVGDKKEFNWRDLVHPEDLAFLQAKLNDHIKGPASRFDARFRLRHKDGHYAWIHSVGRLIERDAQGRALKMTGIHHDISE
ncbi:MAG: hypothetical protein CMF22_10685, partial [Idiomarinaceae bacterium]|nr:hypothetical protein [Idiomarinaceae bacterium]